MTKSQKLTVEEHALCVALGEGYLARSKRGRLIFHYEKPKKNNEIGIWLTTGRRTGRFSGFPHLKFEFITWEDEEPYSIKDLLALPVGE